MRFPGTSQRSVREASEALVFDLGATLRRHGDLRLWDAVLGKDLAEFKASLAKGASESCETTTA